MTQRYILIHHSDDITNTDEGVTFCSQNPQFMVVHQSITFLELQNTILQKIGQQNNKKSHKCFIRCPMVIGKGVLYYRS